MTGHIDFDAVSFAHEKIDARLKNWGRWCRASGAKWVHPMWRSYRPDNWEREVSTAPPTNSLDAQAIQKAVSALPERHRHAIGWLYVAGSNPRKAAQKVGASMAGLYELIVDGRQMLINRRA